VLPLWWFAGHLLCATVHAWCCHLVLLVQSDKARRSM